MNHDRAALFMGCGLGKTGACLYAINEWYHDAAIFGVLIVAPMRVCNLTWPAEVAKWDQFRWMTVANLRTKEGVTAFKNRSAHIYTINYESLPKLAKLLSETKIEKWPFDVVIWDELTRAKNPQSKRIKAVQKFTNRLARHYGLTGTPAPNSLLELFAEIRLLDEGARLGKSFYDFQRTYFYATDFNEYNWVPRKASEEQIYRKLEGFALTLRSSEWLNIPDMVQEDIEVALPKEAEAAYKELERELLLILDSGEVIRANGAAVLVNKLLQLTGGASYTSDGTWVEVHDAKIKALRALVKKVREPVLVAANYRHEQDRIAAAFPEATRFDSASSHKEQEDLVAAWNAGHIPMLIANPMSIGHGLNLQDGGRIVIWYSLTWSRELYDQLNARLARFGQKSVTEVYRLLCPGTIDDAVAETLRVKDETQGALLSALSNWRKLL